MGRYNMIHQLFKGSCSTIFHNCRRHTSSHCVTPCPPSPDSTAFSFWGPGYSFKHDWCVCGSRRGPQPLQCLQYLQCLQCSMQTYQTSNFLRASIACDLCWQALGYIYLSFIYHYLCGGPAIACVLCQNGKSTNHCLCQAAKNRLARLEAAAAGYTCTSWGLCS